MPKLSDGNSSVDSNSGAVLYHKSPELLEIIKLRSDMNTLSNKLDRILELLEGGKKDGGKVEKSR